MNSLFCITPSKAAPRFAARRFAVRRLAGGRWAGAALCALLAACGGTKAPDPAPESPSYPGSEAAVEKRAGSLTFHYNNKSTEASMALDLGEDDVYLDMTGKPAKPEEIAGPARRRDQADRSGDAENPSLSDRTPPAPSPMTSAPRPGPENAPPAPSPAKTSPGRPDPKADPASETEPESAGPDVTDKVLSGIRKAQEFFYQKRYNEALDMVRSSLDARPTAEGHALAGSIHYMLSQPGLAKRHWQEALRLNPDMPAVVNMLEKIRTPGGRGSPFPRPIVSRRPAAAPSGDVIEASKAPGEIPPYPDEYGPEAGRPSAPQAAPAPQPAAPATPPPGPAASAPVSQPAGPGNPPAGPAIPPADDKGGKAR
jgi:hypothetical protein